MTQCIGLSGTTKRTPTRSLERHVEPVEQRAAARQHDAAPATSSAISGVRSSSARCMNSAISPTGPASASAMSRWPQHHALEAALAQVAALDVDLHVAAVGLRQRRAGLDLDALGVDFADDEAVLAAHVAHDGLVHGVAGDPQRARLHDMALRAARRCRWCRRRCRPP